MMRKGPGRPRLSAEEKAKIKECNKRKRKIDELTPIIRQAETIAIRLTGRKDLEFEIPESFPFIGRLKLVEIVFQQLYNMSIRG